MGRVISLIRYRFFLFAGIFPYLLGQAIAFNLRKSIRGYYFWLGFLGVFLVLAGVELFNEYFDAKAGGDRIFSLKSTHIPHYFFPLGILVFLLAFLIGLYFTLCVGWPVLLFSILGFLAAYFYVGPPVRWAYRGLGEAVIGLSYGPFMVMGSYYIQMKRFDFAPFFASLIFGLCIFCLALINEIPDYYQDRLVGKRNLVVKLGRRKAIKVLYISMAGMFLFLGLGIFLKKIPLLAVVTFLTIPWILKSLLTIYENYEKPKVFISAINTNIVTYLAVWFTLTVGYLGD